MNTLNVFVSSTYKDLKKIREHVFWSILKLDCRPCGMELFGSVAASSWDHICGVIDRADVVILIIGERRGSLRSDGKSFTEHEFDYAVQNGKPVLWFWRKPTKRKKAASLSPERLEEHAALEAFRNKCLSFQGSEWSTESELLELITGSLSKHLMSGGNSGGMRKRGGDLVHFRQKVHVTDVPGVRALNCHHVHMPFPGLQTNLSWSEFGVAFNELRLLLENHCMHQGAPVLIGLNESGLGIAGLLQETIFNGKRIGYMRMVENEVKIEFLPEINGAARLLLVDFEIKSGRSLLKFIASLKTQISGKCIVDLACLGAQAQTIGEVENLGFDALDCAKLVRKAGLRRVFFTLIAEDPSVAPPL